MIQEKTARLKRSVNSREIVSLLVLGHVLRHTNRADFVEPRANTEIAEIQHLDLAPMAQSALRNSFLGENRLRGAQSDAGRFHTIVLRGVYHQCTPPATDIEQAIARM